MRTKEVGLITLLLFVTAFLLSPTLGATTTYPLTLTVIGADGKALPSATVKLLFTNGTFVASNVTDSTGKTSFAVPVANTTYLVQVSSKYFALSTIFYNNKAPSMTLNISQFVYANITSKVKGLTGTSVTINANVSIGDAPSYVLAQATNFTVYIPSGKNMTVVYPTEVVSFPFKYTLQNVTYGTTPASGNKVTFAPSKTVVVATYAQSFYMTLEYWVALAIVGVIVIAIIFAWFLGGRKTATHIIEEHEEKARKFVHKKADAFSKFVSTISPENKEANKESFIKEKKFVKRSED